MSTELQQYSVVNQHEAISEYAQRNGFEIVKSYVDSGKSGVTFRRRAGLRSLLADVTRGQNQFRAILVYDVSRWGRFPDSDEAAHYEFLCKRSGVRIHYCAEQFRNDDTVPSAIMKALKRSMAAEFSRELSEKCFAGQRRLVMLGFRMGAWPGYGLRRLLVSADGRHKGYLSFGERKSLTTDHVILVPGRKHEIAVIREMFSMALTRGVGCSAIAQELNRRGERSSTGNTWHHTDVKRLLTNEEYIGVNIWGKTSQKLRSRAVPVERERWNVQPNAFTPVIDQDTFARVQKALRRRAESKLAYTESELLTKLKRLLLRHGYLSQRLITDANGFPSTSTLFKHFESLENLYKLLGYQPTRPSLVKIAARRRTFAVRDQLIQKLKGLPGINLEVHKRTRMSRPEITINGRNISLMMCRADIFGAGEQKWVLIPSAGDTSQIALICLVPKRLCEFHKIYLVPPLEEIMPPVAKMTEHRFVLTDHWLRGREIDKLSDLPQALETLSERCAAKVFRAYRGTPSARTEADLTL